MAKPLLSQSTASRQLWQWSSLPIDPTALVHCVARTDKTCVPSWRCEQDCPLVLLFSVLSQSLACPTTSAHHRVSEPKPVTAWLGSKQASDFSMFSTIAEWHWAYYYISTHLLSAFNNLQTLHWAQVYHFFMSIFSAEMSGCSSLVPPSNIAPLAPSDPPFCSFSIVSWGTLLYLFFICLSLRGTFSF